MTPRIPPMTPPFTPAVTQALERIMPPGVPPLALFTTLANNERVFLRVMAGGLLDRGAVTLGDRELVIHRTCARLGSEYEWGVHVAFFAQKAGLGASDIRATLAPAARVVDTGLGAREQLIFQLVDELVDTSTVSDALWMELERQWSPEQLVELVALVGFYHLIAFTTNAFRVPLEAFAARFEQFGGASEAARSVSTSTG